MRELVFHGPGRLTVEDAPDPEPGPDEVRVRVSFAGVCGSDVHGYQGANDRRVPQMVMGHEASGVIDATGADFVDLAVGTPVAINPAVTCGHCDFCLTPGQDNLCLERRLYGCVRDLPGAFADLIVVKAANVVALEGPAPLEWGALVEPFAVGDHGVAQLSEPPAEGVLVIGGGPIGLGAALAARRRGNERVVLSETVAHRRAIAEALGLETMDPAAGGPAPEPFGAVIECVALAVTLKAGLASLVPRGLVVLVGLGELELPLPVTPVVVGERGVRGSFNYTRESFDSVARWVMSGAQDLSAVIESRVGLEGLVAVFAEYANGSRTDVKTLFEPG